MRTEDSADAAGQSIYPPQTPGPVTEAARQATDIVVPGEEVWLEEPSVTRLHTMDHRGTEPARHQGMERIRLVRDDIDVRVRK